MGLGDYPGGGFINPLASSISTSWANKTNNKNARTFVVIHGYLSSANEGWVKNIERALSAKFGSANVLSIGWNSGGIYFDDLHSIAEKAGEDLAKYLKNEGISSENVTVVGHSMGAHVAAWASQKSADLTGQKFDTIHALDPAGVGYEKSGSFTDLFRRTGLTNTSARNVVVLHTSKNLGYERNVGTLDIYVNGGTEQPGERATIDPTYDHSYAHTLYTQLLEGKRFRQSDGTFFDLNSLNNLKKTVNVSTTNSLSGFSSIKSEISGVDFSDIFQADDSLIFQVKTTNSCRGQATHSVSVSKNALIEIDQAADQLSEEYSFGIMTQSTSTPFDAKTLWNEKVLALSSTNSEASHFFDNINIV
jgi:pimeloyl-ACP methyl ester carboxylesterase